MTPVIQSVLSVAIFIPVAIVEVFLKLLVFAMAMLAAGIILGIVGAFWVFNRALGFRGLKRIHH